MACIFLTPEALAKRWHVLPATLNQWRWSGKGPFFLKIGGSIRYRLDDIERFEKQNLRRSTTDNPEGCL